MGGGGGGGGGGGLLCLGMKSVWRLLDGRGRGDGRIRLLRWGIGGG